MDTNFDIKDWSERHELEAETLQTLAEKGFKSKKTFAKLTPEVIKKEFKGLQLGQVYLLQDAIMELQPESPSGEVDIAGCQGEKKTTKQDDAEDNTQQPVPSTSGASQAATSSVGAAIPAQTLQNIQTKMDQGTLLSTADILQLMAPNRPKQTEATVQQGKQEAASMVFDPFQFSMPDGKIPTKGSKVAGSFRDIRDFIALAAPSKINDNDSGVLSVGDIQMTLKTSKPPLEKIRFSQYMEGSSLILRAMILEDNIDMPQVLQYLSYQTKIATFAQVYQWYSVLQYDFHYRKSQAELGFPWGADNAYLMQMFLKVHPGDNSGNTKPGQKAGQGAGRPRQGSRYDPQTGKQVCGKWNSQAGCDFPRCNYAHVCLTCFKSDHPKHMHGTQNQQPIQAPKNP